MGDGRIARRFASGVVIEAVYIASPHGTHFGYAKSALAAGRHVRCEKPITFLEDEATQLHSLATEKGLVLIEAIKTAFMPDSSE